MDVSDVPEISYKQKEQGRRAFCVSSFIYIPSRRIFIYRFFPDQFPRVDVTKQEGKNAKRAIVAKRNSIRERGFVSCFRACRVESNRIESRRDELDRRGERRKTDCF